MSEKHSREKLITIDVGNSRIKLGLFEKNRDFTPAGALPEYIRSMAINLDEAVPWDELASWTADAPGSVHSVILGGVNPRGRDMILDNWPKSIWPEPVVIDNPFILPIKINVNSPRTVGVDRLLNAIAGNIIRPPGKPMLIIDSGTATTVDLVAADGAFEGGAILPGFQLGATALHQYTALLPHISNPELARRTPDPVGKNTRDALKSGLFWGQLGAVKELVRHYQQTLTTEPICLVTGGAGRLLMPQMPEETIHEPYLALQGLVIVGHSLNNKRNVQNRGNKK
ncbi:MAG: type III pantothenate kinase [Calditrichaeota bacterium]|nr:type III pantothenate kinase [Calditrichota bacterium]